jgi:signal transduction histidine kinase
VHRLFRTAIAMMGLLWPAICSGADESPRSVLILSQGLPGGPWPSAVHQAIRSTLLGNGSAPVVDYIEELDLGRFGSPEYEELLRGYLREKYRQKPIGVIIAVGSDAFELLLRLRTELWPKVPVVFAGVDEATAARLKFPVDVTGSTMRLRILDAVTAAKILVPEFERIALVGGPFERDPYRRHLIDELPQFATELQFIDASKLTMAEIRQHVATLPRNVVIYYTAIYADTTGATYSPRDALGLVAEAANRPIVIDAETSIGHGPTGGFVITPVAVGEDAARRALRILGGESASNIPVTAGDSTRPIFDWRQLKRFGVNEARLPPGSEVRFRELTAWDRYRWQIILIATAILLQTTLIIWLFFEHRRRRMAEAASRGAMSRLAHMNRVATAGELSASIAHEVNQPLAAIVANANAGLRFLAGAKPDLDEARLAFESVVSAGHRAGDVVGSVRAMFKKDGEEKAPLDLNDTIQDVLGLLRGELQMQGIIVHTELQRALPLVQGHGGQLQQVLLNLVRNAAEAMGSISDRARLLRVKSAIHDSGGVLVSIEDSGTGIDPKVMNRIFDSFFTTKSQGMGMGLSICRSIVEFHHGRLWASADIEHGAAFNVLLPVAGSGDE